MNANDFSLRRLALLWRFYTPAIRKQLVLSGAILLASYLICLWGASGCLGRDVDEVALPMALYSFGGWIASWMYLSGPLVFGFCSQRRVATTLPASWQEKSVFMFGYVFVVVPLLLAAIWFGAMGVASLFTDAADVNAVVLNMVNSETEGINLTSLTGNSRAGGVAFNMLSAAFGCLVIASVRRNRIALGVVALIAIQFVNWLSGVALGIYAVFKTRMVQKIAAGESPDVSPQDLIDVISGVMPVYYTVCAIAAVAVVVLTVLKIKNRQN